VRGVRPRAPRKTAGVQNKKGAPSALYFNITTFGQVLGFDRGLTVEYFGK
jgi:hypothetical protein